MVTDQLIERLRNLGIGAVREPLLILDDPNGAWIAPAFVAYAAGAWLARAVGRATCSRYQSSVRRSPSSSVTRGAQPDIVRSLVESTH